MELNVFNEVLHSQLLSSQDRGSILHSLSITLEKHLEAFELHLHFIESCMMTLITRDQTKTDEVYGYPNNQIP